MKGLLLLLVAAAPAWGQFELYLVDGGIEQPVGRTYNFGSVEPGAPLAVPFRIRNISTAAASLDLLTVNGAGFSLVNASMPIPAALAPQQSLDFGLLFQSSGTGNYSAELDSVGIKVILTAQVPVELTCQLLTATGVQPCAAATMDFGLAPQGSPATIEIVLLNQTSAVLIAPDPQITGDGFSLSGPSPGGTVLQPTESIAFDIQFNPTADGVSMGTLAIGDRSYALTGTGLDSLLPQPQITLALPQAESAQQGAVTIDLGVPSQTSGTGTVTLAFVPVAALSWAAPDPGIAFASGRQTATFTVSAGDTQGHFGADLSMPFQTGTTEGTLTITAQLGSFSAQQSIAILPAAVGVTGVAGVRAAGSIEVDVTGFDNTRTAGALSFTFYDAAGNAIGVPIQADGTSAFATYFQGSAGGTFELKAVFPVVGNAGQIVAVQAAVTNSAGVATAARTSF